MFESPWFSDWRLQNSNGNFSLVKITLVNYLVVSVPRPWPLNHWGLVDGRRFAGQSIGVLCCPFTYVIPICMYAKLTCTSFFRCWVPFISLDVFTSRVLTCYYISWLVFVNVLLRLILLQIFVNFQFLLGNENQLYFTFHESIFLIGIYFTCTSINIGAVDMKIPNFISNYFALWDVFGGQLLGVIKNDATVK